MRNTSLTMSRTKSRNTLSNTTLRHTLHRTFHTTAFFCLLFLPPGQIPSALGKNTDLPQQRALYKQVKQSLDGGSTRLFQQHRKKLKDYPLFPYLEYAHLSHRLSLDDEPAVKVFLERYPDIWLSSRLRRNWLNLLYGKGLWQQYLEYYQPSTANTEATCHFNFARYQLGQKQAAMEGAINLWLVGKSQPKSCDPLFRLLISEQRIDNELAWQRYSLAVLNHKYALARYIERFFTSKKYRSLATNYLALDRNPARVGEYELFDIQTPEVLAVIEHGIRHLAKKNATLALKHWARYLQTHPFDEDARSRMLPTLVKGLDRQGYPNVATDYLFDQIDIADTKLLEWQLRKDITKADWRAVTRLVGNLPETRRQEQRWRYWQARAILLHTTNADDIDSAKTTFRELSRFRSFYGFLASDWVGNPYNMQHAPVSIPPETISAMAMQPAMQRVKELRYHQQDLYARREWYAAGKHFSSEDWQSAAQLARQWQWHGQAILAMTRANYWDDIDIRFPLVFQKEFKHHAQLRGLPLPLILGLSRQESAFRPAVSSPAGARGLMQLMPATAREVARQHKVPYRNSSQLVDPDLNIHLGSLYYQGVLQRFGGNRILASAAYNAGPHRVNRWLKKSAGTLPFDAWVETIPFSETRQYVQNVLAFAIIYAHHLEQDYRLLSAEERARLL